ncbi:MAG: hypothetical protein ACE5JU_18820 [Candidatus Binatia bacterium]
MILALTLQPLVKIAVGYLSGIRFSYAYVWYIEPRFKMRYGTYLALSRWRRVLFQLSGAVGTPLAFGIVSLLAAPKLQAVAAICAALFWITVAIQVTPFLAGLTGARRFGLGSLARVTSAGLAAMEVREGCLPGKR